MTTLWLQFQVPCSMFQVTNSNPDLHPASEGLMQRLEKEADTRRDQRRKPEVYRQYIEELRRGRTK